MLAIETNCENKTSKKSIERKKKLPKMPGAKLTVTTTQNTSQNAPLSTPETTNVSTTNEPPAIDPDNPIAGEIENNKETPQETRIHHKKKQNDGEQAKSTQRIAGKKHKVNDETRKPKQKKSGAIKKIFNNFVSLLNPFKR